MIPEYASSSNDMINFLLTHQACYGPFIIKPKIAQIATEHELAAGSGFAAN